MSGSPCRCSASGRYAEAAQALRTIPTPGYWSLARLAACYGALGLASEAAATKAAILAERPDFTIADFMQRDVLLERADAPPGAAQRRPAGVATVDRARSQR